MTRSGSARTTLVPDDRLTTMNTPSPSGEAGSGRSTPVGFGSSGAPGRGGTTSAPTPATAAPSASPPTTSESQCAPVCIRE